MREFFDILSSYPMTSLALAIFVIILFDKIYEIIKKK